VGSVRETTRYIQNQSPNEAEKKDVQCILPVLTCGAEILILTKTSAMKLERIQRKMETSMLGINLRDKVRNEEICKRTESGNGPDILQERVMIAGLKNPRMETKS